MIEAACQLGCTPGTLKNRMASIRDKVGVDRTFQVIYVLTASGELEVPDLRRE